VSMLQANTHCPTQQDMDDLYRLLWYLEQTKHYGLVISPDINQQPPTIDASADAAYAMHSDASSHGGTIVWFAGVPIHWSSKKHNYVSGSSTLAELYQANLALGPIEKARDFATGLGFQLPPSVLWQDNHSTLTLATQGFGKALYSHMWIVRAALLKQQQVLGNVRLEYQPTEEMVADGLTKALELGPFEHFRERMCVRDLNTFRVNGRV
jgi:hypothetical protein